ncbi:hypothetical protein CHS0354_035229 [Potamilus streckersoni]|uniref:Galactose oxidase n=1 Tax=Potamilus streckersoni TaxID=2493646 RepID=A0AAE0S2Y2_9BIVA|nr:hypothetical protein CHS0354_035229 [Potamilus streckersoni]
MCVHRFFYREGRTVYLFRLYALAVLSFFALACNEFFGGRDSGGNDNTSSGFSARDGHTAAVFKDGTRDALWVIGGGLENGDVWKSTDGITWTQATSAAGFSGRAHHAGAVFDGALWVIGGYDGYNRLNDVWKSTDGITWTQVNAGSRFSARYRHTATVFKDGTRDALWVIGGWDGSNWTEVTDNAGFAARDGHTAAVFDDGSGNALWVIGGDDFSSAFNDVWKSTDGKNWTEVTDNAGFSKRYAHTATVFNDGTRDALWVIGGYGGSDSLNPKSLSDVWKSADGKNWTEVTGAGFTARYYHTATVFDGALWVAGGWDSSKYLNEVWKYP